MTRGLSLILSFFHYSLGVGALVSGFLLILDPSGQRMALTLEILAGTVFHDYLIPGILLFLFIGLGNSLAVVLTKKRRDLAPYSGLVLGLVLIIWIIVQVSMIGYLSLLQPLCLFFGVIMMAAGILLYKGM